jgi:hypothetical protein
VACLFNQGVQRLVQCYLLFILVLSHRCFVLGIASHPNFLTGSQRPLLVGPRTLIPDIVGSSWEWGWPTRCRRQALSFFHLIGIRSGVPAFISAWLRWAIEVVWEGIRLTRVCDGRLRGNRLSPACAKAAFPGHLQSRVRHR